jgi:hypothetical protein
VRLGLIPPALEIDPIQLNYETDLPIGTTVKIRVTKVKKDPTGVRGTNIITGTDLWDWYCLDAPSVVRLQGREKKVLRQSATVPAEESGLPRGWHLLPSSSYRTVHALVHGTSGSYVPDLVCNGIKVKETGFGLLFPTDRSVINWKRDLFPGQGVFNLHVPDFSIFDPDGNLPLNLQRTGLTNQQFDFLTEAFAAQAKAALTQFLLAAPAEPKLTDKFLKVLTGVFGFQQTIPVFFTSIGTALLTSTNLRAANLKNCLLVNMEVFTQGWLTHVQDRYDAIVVARWGGHGTSPIYSLNELSRWIARARVITRSGEGPVVGKPLRFRYKEFSVDGLHIYRTADCPPSLLQHEDIEILRDRFPAPENAKELKSAKDFIAAELFLKDPPPSKGQPDLSMGRYWEQIIRGPVVPFSSTERRTKLSHAYDALREYFADFPETANDTQ